MQLTPFWTLITPLVLHCMKHFTHGGVFGREGMAGRAYLPWNWDLRNKCLPWTCLRYITSPSGSLTSQVHKEPTVNFKSNGQQEAIDLGESWWIKYSRLSFLCGFCTHMSPHCLSAHSQWGRIRMEANHHFPQCLFWLQDGLTASSWKWNKLIRYRQFYAYETMWQLFGMAYEALGNWSPSLVSSSSTCHFLPCSYTRWPVPFYSRWGTKQVKAIFQNSKDWCSTSFRLQLWVSVTCCRNKTRMGAVVPKSPVWKAHSCKRQREFKGGGISCLCMIHLCGSLILGCLSFFISGVIFFFPYPVIF